MDRAELDGIDRAQLSRSLLSESQAVRATIAPDLNGN